MSTSRIYKNQYLTIEATTNGSVSVFLSSALTTTDLASFSYSKDQTHWTTTNTDGTDKTITINLNGGEKLYLKGSGKTYNHATNNANPIFTITCYANVYGNIMSLLYGDNFRTADTVYDYSFMSMFRNCTTIDTLNLVMPATTLGTRCYESMFRGCTNLIKAPALPATTLATYCYRCMFYDCSSLTNKISLSSTSLANYCYDSMFRNCTSLTVAPSLAATTLVTSCYYNMFRGCTNLTSIKMLATDISASNCLANWVNGVAATGTFTKNTNMSTLPTGDSGIPTGWTVKNYVPGQQGTVYDFGDTIPGYVSLTYEPKIWYDQSKSVSNGTWDIFNELGIAESLILGESEDDLWTFEEILEEICKYFNLHIVQLGYDFYIFDWETAKSGQSVTWRNILDGTTKNSTYSVITPTLSSYADDSTQISLGECYDQIMLTDEVEEFDDVILSPFDDENLINIMSRQHYMKELFATGQGNKARDAFVDLLNGGVGTTYNDSDSAYTRDWWFNIKGSKYWKFTLNGDDVYDQIPEDGNGGKYKQWMLAQYVDETPFASAIFSWGHGDKINNKNQQNIENITSFTDYIVINVAGNGYDENSPTSETVYDPNTGMPTGTQPTHIFPSDSDLQNCGMKIEYINANDGVYSSADSSIMHYLVFSGKLLLATAHERTGSEGFAGYENDSYNIWTRYANEGRSGYHYVDNTVFKRKTNTYQNIKNMVDNNLYIKGRCVGSDDNDDGRYYTNLFYNQNYPEYSDAPYPTVNFVAPPCAEGDISKRFKYDLNGKYSYYAKDGGWDVIPYVDILACTLQIGDKYCVETVQNNKKHFEWYTETELQNMNMYTALGDGTVIYNAFIYLAVNIDDGQYLIGESHDIYNNVSTNMNLDKSGMAIPLPANEHLHGELRFAIVGPVNNTWDNGVRRHPTWFRHTTYTPNVISILPHVDKIYIEKFDVALVSDNGKKLINEENDIIYLSDEVKKYTKRKDDINFKFNTALTANEAAAMGVKPILAKSTVLNMSTGDAILNIVNNATSETDKPERFYVDAYWREYNDPRMVVNTALKDTNSFEYLDVTQFNKLQLSFIDDKTFFVTKTERDLKNEKINITIKERND